MSFAVPWILALGCIAAFTPIVVHLLTRPRPARVSLSTLAFVRDAIRQRRATSRLRDFLVLALRTAAILLLAAAFAGPFWGRASLIGEDHGDTVRVVVLDVSQSMGALDGNTTGMQKGLSTADRYLKFQRGLHANLILADARPQIVFDNVSTNFEALREELSRAKVAAERIDVDAALELAAQQLAPIDEQDHRRRELIVISDFQRTNWGASTFAGLPPETKIQLESVAPAKTAANLAILSATCTPVGAQRDRLQWNVAVANYGASGRKATLETELGGAIYRASISCPPQETTKFSQEIPAPQAGWLWGTARITDADDALAADNQRPLVLQNRGQPTFAVIAQPQSGGALSSAQLLSYALAPNSEGETSVRQVVQIDPSRLDNQSLSEVDLIAVDHVGKLSAEHLGLLARRLRLGSPVLYVASDPVDALNLAALTKEAQIELPVRLVPPPSGTTRRNLRLSPTAVTGPPLSIFGDSLPALVKQLRFSGGLAAQSAAPGTAADDRIRAKFDDGTPAIIVVQTQGGGSLAILNMDLVTSNVWKSGALIPILDELVQELMSSDGGDDVFFCGEPLFARFPISSGAQTLQIVRDPAGPDAEASLGRLEDDGDSTVWQWDSPKQPGVCRVTSQDETVFAAAIAVPAEESDLTALPADVVSERLAAGFEVAYRDANVANVAQDDLWIWLVVGATLCLLSELGLLLAFRT
ncbi:vWA domain-containing protein [Blastopirellula marina]|uniref:Aerotolerance regulator N-terminal domain-containing protein n=1 Tax=Blastopirellula marina TaxID=124 RepID=A0A2S8FAB2_9BACT|nr:BatA and WFA domain-containing protein [Blastopirellula marina]PQO29060.1 hypothetical protein C5Y98_22915 [Blastopirellula marina]PTL42331.1 VWA domain-containing protein [Blastopirellula marina]